MIRSLIFSLIATIVLELAFSYVFGIREKKDFILVILVNIYTNPIVVFLANTVYLMNIDLVYYCSVLILEIGAITMEALLYKQYLKAQKNPIKLSIYSNIFSFSMGIILIFL